MITRNLHKRFTAPDALHFVEKIILESEEYQLSKSEYKDSQIGLFTYETYDRWECLTADFQIQWSAYREPVGIPFSSRILRAILVSDWLPGSLIPRVRWLVSRITSIPRLIWGQLFHFTAGLRA